VRCASWNVNSLRVRLPQVLDWLESAQPDLIGLQETKTQDDDFPLIDIEAAGYEAVYSGQKTYNGVAILSRLPFSPTDVVTGIPGLDDPQRRILAATYGEIRFINVYVPNGSVVGSDKYGYKLEWLNKLYCYLKQQLEQYQKLIVVGDFNIAPEDRDVHDPQAWEGSVLVSPKERQAFHSVQQLGLYDSFRLFNSDEGKFSWWDYRAAAFRRNMGLRIDHILVSQSLRDSCTGCSIDTEPRRWERPSDHAPVYADFIEHTYQGDFWETDRSL
jgi:exodeoxyribonuclease-3